MRLVTFAFASCFYGHAAATVGSGVIWYEVRLRRLPCSCDDGLDALDFLEGFCKVVLRIRETLNAAAKQEVCCCV